MIDSYMQVLRKYAQFSGRARRREYWSFFLVSLLLVIVVDVAAALLDLTTGRHRGTTGFDNAAIAIEGIYFIAVLIPSVAVSIRRLHDVGKSGWFILLGFIPFVGALVLLVFHCMDSQPGPNRFGPNPKAVAEANPYGYAPIS